MAFRSHSTAGNASSTTLVIAYPSGMAAGDILCLHVYVEDITLTPAFDKGTWTKVTTASGENINAGGPGNEYEIHEYWARVVSESGNLTISWGGASVFNVGIMAAFSGRLASGSPLDSSPDGTYNEADPAASTAFSATGVTSLHDDADICIMGASIQATTYGSWTAGITEQVEIGNSVLARGVQAVAGTTGNKTATLSVSANWAAALTVIRAAAAAIPLPVPSYLGFPKFRRRSS